jgi:hypothetical protein
LSGVFFFRNPPVNLESRSIQPDLDLEPGRVASSMARRDGASSCFRTKRHIQHVTEECMLYDYIVVHVDQSPRQLFEYHNPFPVGRTAYVLQGSPASLAIHCTKHINNAKYDAQDAHSLDLYILLHSRVVRRC